MSDTPEARLQALGITLPQPPAPVATYVPSTRGPGDIVNISGQVSFDQLAGKRHQGIVGEDLSLEEAQAAARVCAINLIAQMRAACEGDLSRVKRILKVNGFVQAGPSFFDIPQVINGASDLLVEVFGDAGRHARSAVGVYRLPLNFAVEVDCVVWAL
jgi:enamine deaminase RidA (YjgF/YER057c/UK114 family)